MAELPDGGSALSGLRVGDAETVWSGMHVLPDGGFTLSGLRVGDAETVWLGMHVLPDGGSALSGLRVGDAETAWWVCTYCRMAAPPYPAYGWGMRKRVWGG